MVNNNSKWYFIYLFFICLFFRYNYVNVFPQWFLSSNLWTEVEESVKRELARNSYSRRVIVSGSYGTYTLPDSYDKEQPLYLIMPQRQVSVPRFLWKMIHDADNIENSIVFICPNNPRPDEGTIMDHDKFPCDQVPCPETTMSNMARMLFCCDKKSFEREYGKFDYEVFKVPPRAYIQKELNALALKHLPPWGLSFAE